MLDTQQMRTWAEVDLSALEHNYHTIKEMLPQDCGFLGLCKANAYGHGSVEIGKKLQALGADMLAVACLDEGIELRQAGVTIPIICLGQTDSAYTEHLLHYDLIQTVCDLKTGQEMSKQAVTLGKTLQIHVKLDTGMTRLGFFWHEGREEGVLDEIFELCRLPGLAAQGFFTHLADSGVDEAYTMAQLDRFLRCREELEKRGIHFKICHCANSGGRNPSP